MLWTHPLLLSGLAALAVPVVIHLMMRAQGRKVVFSTLRFLPRSQPARERKRIRHWPLLLLRLLLIALLVSAFARPFWPDTAGAATRERARAVVLVLDRSASMQAKEGDSTRWDAALASARKLLGTLSGNDRVAVVGFAQEAEVLAPWGPAAIAEHALSGLSATNEPGKLADGLRVAAQLLEHAPAGGDLVIVGDLQKSGCAGLDTVSLPAGTHCDVRPVSRPETANVAVTDLRVADSGSTALTVDLRNFSSLPQTTLPVKALLDGQPFYEGKIDLAAGAAAHLTLPALAAKPGWHAIQVNAAAGDALAPDDSRGAGVFIPPPIPVLVAEPHPEKRNFARASYFLTSALDPNYSDDPAVSPAPGPFAVTVVEADKLAAALAANPKPAVVVLPPLPTLPDGLGAALAAFVHGGGGVLAWVAAGVDTLGYDNQFSIFSPARLIEPEAFQSLEPGGGWRLGWWNRDSALFGRIGEGTRGDLTLPQFKQRMQLAVDPDAEVLATFGDKTPFLLLRQVGRGRVLLVNASSDTEGSDWPIHKTYLPMVQRMAYYLAQRDPQAGFAVGASLVPARHAQLELGTMLANRSLLLVPPVGAPISIRSDAAGVVHDANLETLGTYAINDEKGATLSMVSVNFPASESDLTALRPDEVSSQLQFTAPVVGHLNPGGTFSARYEIWPWLLLALLPLLAVELAWANRIRT
jgi:hypothetical protein